MSVMLVHSGSKNFINILTGIRVELSLDINFANTYDFQIEFLLMLFENGLVGLVVVFDEFIKTETA
jgi:hypothetical protein